MLPPLVVLIHQIFNHETRISHLICMKRKKMDETLYIINTSYYFCLSTIPNQNLSIGALGICYSITIIILDT